MKAIYIDDDAYRILVSSVPRGKVNTFASMAVLLKLSDLLLGLEKAGHVDARRTHAMLLALRAEIDKLQKEINQ